MVNPIAAFSFDESGSTVLDYTNNGYDFDLTATNGVRTAGGNTNGGITKSGAGLVPLATQLLTDCQTDSRTIMVWVKGNGAAWYVRCNHSDIDSGGWGIVTLDGGTNIGVRARNADGASTSQLPIPGGGSSFYHIAGTYDGINLRTYLNGVLVDTRAVEAPLRTDADSLDMMEWTTGDTILDDLRFYDIALDVDQIIDAMNTPVDFNVAAGRAIRYFDGTWKDSPGLRIFNGTSWVTTEPA